MMIAKDVSFEDYRGLPYLSNTALGYLAKSPAHYLERVQHPEDDESDALRLGRLVHMCVLEPEKYAEVFDRHYAIKPNKMSFATRDGKEWRANHVGKEIVTWEEGNFLRVAAGKIAEHKTASKMLKAGLPELTVTAALDGIPVKCRIDFATTGNALVDLKTARDASPRGFQKAIVDRGYHRQAAFYLDVCKAVGLEKQHFTFLAIEKEPPYLLACYRLDEQAIFQGRKEYQRLLAIYKECTAAGSWPGYSEKLEEIGLPAWAVKDTPDPAWMNEAA